MGKEQRSLPETASRSSCKLGRAPELPAAGMDQERWTGCSSLGGRCADSQVQSWPTSDFLPVLEIWVPSLLSVSPSFLGLTDSAAEPLALRL